MNQRIIFIILIASMLLVAGCAKPAIMVMKKEPGNSTEAARLRQVAVVQFSGRNGDKFTSELETMIAGIKVDDKQFFDIVNRSRLNEVFAEQKLSISGDFNQEAIVNIGRLVGAKGIYTGDILISSINSSNFNSERYKCVQSKGMVCEKSEKYYVNCTKKDALLKVNPKLIDVETGKIVYSETYEGKDSTSKCADSSSTLKSDAEMMNTAIGSVLSSIRRDVAPHIVPVKIVISEVSDGIVDKKMIERFDSAIAFAKSNRMDRACEIWDEIVKTSAASVGLYHNIGICAELDGRLEDAMIYLKKADKLTTSPDDTVSESLRRVQRDLVKNEKLKAQNVN